MKWFKALRDFVRDIKSFLRVRSEQRKMYSPIIDDLETINTLADALSNQIREFSQKWNMFPETKALIETYRKYVLGSKEIYKSTRTGILNTLLSERNQKPIDESKESVQVHRVNTTERFTGDEDFFKGNELLGKVLRACDVSHVGDAVYITVDEQTRMFLGTLIKNKEKIEEYCREHYGEDTSVEIIEKEISAL